MMPRPTDWASHGDSDMMAPGQSRSASHAARAGGVGRGGSRLRPGIRAPTATAAATVSRLSRPEPAMPLAVTVLTEFPGPPSSHSLGPARAACLPESWRRRRGVTARTTDSSSAPSYRARPAGGGAPSARTSMSRAAPPAAGSLSPSKSRVKL